MVKVLFVCLGNICRSPMAEAMFRHIVKNEGLDDKITVDSAGTGDWHIGDKPHEGTYNLLVEKGINADGIQSRQINQADFKTSQYIVAMDAQNVTDIKKFNKEGVNTKIFRLMDLVKDEETKNIPDPYYTGNFDEVYDLIEAGCEQLLAYIKKEEQL